MFYFSVLAHILKFCYAPLQMDGAEGSMPKVQCVLLPKQSSVYVSTSFVGG